MNPANTNSKDKVVMLTGAGGTIGMAVAYQLASGGAKLRLIFSNRDRPEIRPHKVENLLSDIMRKTGNTNIKAFYCDISSQKEVRRLVAEYLSSTNEPVDVLINNAAIYCLKDRMETAEKLEINIATNYLGPYLLTLMLLERLKLSRSARIINVCSNEYTFVKDFEAALSNYNAQRGFFREQYGFSKLGLIYLTRILSKLLSGTAITVNAMHPGPVPSNMWRNLPALLQLQAWLSRILIPVLSPGTILTPEEAAKTYLYLAFSPDVQGISGRYFSKGKEEEFHPLALNDEYAKKMWSLGGELTGLRLQVGKKNRVELEIQDASVQKI